MNRSNRMSDPTAKEILEHLSALRTNNNSDEYMDEVLGRSIDMIAELEKQVSSKSETIMDYINLVADLEAKVSELKQFAIAGQNWKDVMELLEEKNLLDDFQMFLNGPIPKGLL